MEKDKAYLKYRLKELKKLNRDFRQEQRKKKGDFSARGRMPVFEGSSRDKQWVVRLKAKIQVDPEYVLFS